MFDYQRRIGMRDVDAGGVLFFARYFSLVHEATEEMFALHGMTFKHLVEEHGVVFPVIHAKADYRLPLSIGETVGIHLAVKDVSRRTFTLAFAFRTAEKLAAEGALIHACVDCTTRRATALPEHVATMLQAGS